MSPTQLSPTQQRLLAIAVIACTASTADAGVTYMTQSRTVTVNATWADSEGGKGSDSATDAAPDTAPYDATIGAVTTNSSADATQTSTLNPARITAVGTALGTFSGAGGLVGGCNATSDLSVTFEVVEAIDYTVDGEITAGTTMSFLSVQTSVSLVDGSGTTIFQVAPPYCEFGCTNPLALSGTLQPGTYTLAAEAQVSGMMCCGVPLDEGHATFDLDMTLGTPCLGDTNGDTVIDVDDLIAVILDWATDGSGHGGDVNGSGLVDVDDLVQVILTFGPCD